MLQVQYAAANSPGLLASNIGWINYGPNLSLSNGSSTTITNSIPGGYTISFDLSLNITGNPSVIPQIIYQSSTSPTFSAAPFGNTAYTGIPGQVILYTGQNPTINNVMNITLSLKNIIVLDCHSCLVPNYTLFAADSEVTNKGANSEAELWSVTTNGLPWFLTQLMPSISGNTTAGPVVTGTNTQTVLETGQASSASMTSANVFSTLDATELIATARVDGGRQGFAFGIMITKSKQTYLDYIYTNEINLISPTIIQKSYLSSCSCRCAVSLCYNGHSYILSNHPTTIVGQLATYVFNQNLVTIIPNGTKPSCVFDAFGIRFSNASSDVLVVFKADPYAN